MKTAEPQNNPTAFPDRVIARLPSKPQQETEERTHDPRYKEIAFVAYPVTDIARARQFYEGVLNLKPNAPLESEQPHWIEYDIGSGTLGHRVFAAMAAVTGWRVRGTGGSGL